MVNFSNLESVINMIIDYDDDDADSIIMVLHSISLFILPGHMNKCLFLLTLQLRWLYPTCDESGCVATVQEQSTRLQGNTAVRDVLATS